ncbi:MAG: hypothetical protein J6K17_09525 [Oscillospiraceae bacterium]|nr:hypothetical protein [Oscillospiraceae bacterium]
MDYLSILDKKKNLFLVEHFQTNINKGNIVLPINIVGKKLEYINDNKFGYLLNKKNDELKVYLATYNLVENIIGAVSILIYDSRTEKIVHEKVIGIFK